MKKVSFIVFLGLLTAAAAMAQNFPKEIAHDTNKDGRPDRWEHFNGTKLEKIEIDNNRDGKLDEVVYAENGVIVRSEKDTDFDGLMDQWLKY